MQGDPKVIAALQQGLNAEATLANAYCLNGKDQKRRGMKTGNELLELKRQCCRFEKMLIKHLLFLDATVELEPEPVTVGDDLGATLDELIGMEAAIVVAYTDAVTVCYDAADMSNFHLMQHLVRWHKEGAGDFIGHLKYLEHEKFQHAKLGDKDYFAVHI